MNRNIIHADPVQADNEYPVEKSEHDKELGVSTVDDGHLSDSSEEKVAPDFQHGVQASEAVTLIWSKRDLIIAYCL